MIEEESLSQLHQNCSNSAKFKKHIHSFQIRAKLLQMLFK